MLTPTLMSFVIGIVLIIYLSIEVLTRTTFKKRSLFFTDMITPVLCLSLNAIVLTIFILQVDAWFIVGILEGSIVILLSSIALTVVKAVLYYTPSEKVQINNQKKY
ncbi:hypothetical protein MKX54_20425 [Alkalihalobacillus sp. FSL R5-0424]